MAEGLARDLASYAFGLIKEQPLKCFVMIEDDDGNRFWAANGKLRSEFLHERKVENRNWGMFEQEDVPPATSTNLKDHPPSDPSSSRRDRKRGNSPRRRSPSRRDRDRDRRPSRPSDADGRGPPRDRDRSHHSGGHSKHSVHDIQYNKDRYNNLDEVDFEDAGHDGPSSVRDVGDPRSFGVDSGGFDSGPGRYDPLDVCPSCGCLGHDVPDCPLILNQIPPSYRNGANTDGSFMGAYNGGNNFGNNFGNGDGFLSQPSLMEVPAVPTGMFNLENIRSGPSQHRCFNCHNPGHFAAECPLLLDIRFQLQPDDVGETPLVIDHEPLPDPRACFNCREPGHIAAECPMPEMNAPDAIAMSHRRIRNGKARGKDKGGTGKSQSGRNVFKGRPDSKSKEKKSADTSSRRNRSRSPRKARSPSPEGDNAREELRPLLRTLEERGTLKYKWLVHGQKYLLILPSAEGKSDTLINVENLQDLSEASEKYGFLDDVNVVKEQVAPAKPSSTRQPEVNDEPPPKDHPLAQSLAQLEEKALLRYKWLANSQKYLLIIPNGASNSDTLINIGSVEELVDAAKTHGFGHEISSLMGKFDSDGAETASSAPASTSATIANPDTDPSADLLASTLADLANRGTLKYKWFAKAKQFRITIPQIGKGVKFVNINNMKQLLNAARKHNFTILGD